MHTVDRHKISQLQTRYYQKKMLKRNYLENKSSVAPCTWTPLGTYDTGHWPKSYLLPLDG